MIDLESIYRATLDACAPEKQVAGRKSLIAGFRNVVAIGKCAGRLVDGLPDFDRALVAIPRGYPPPRVHRPSSRLRIMTGGHPDIDDDSFAAGEQLLRFVDECDDVLFLVSGGGSACVEVPLPPFTRDEIAGVNARLVASGLPIGAINTVRKHLSAIKGGRLAARVRGRSLTLVYSDVSSGAIGDVASGPTVADRTTKDDAARILERLGGCDRIVTKLRDESVPDTVHHIGNTTAETIADNGTLTAAAAQLVRDADYEPVLVAEQIEVDVDRAARMLAERAVTLREGEVIVAGGEPTVVRRGSGKGGRCCELAVRFALALRERNIGALFGSSDGVDGSSGVAAIRVEGGGALTNLSPLPDLLSRSESLRAAEMIGRAVMIPPTGNNLRDLFLVSRVRGTMAYR